MVKSYMNMKMDTDIDMGVRLYTYNREWTTAFNAYIDPFDGLDRGKLLYFASNLPSSADMEKRIIGQKLIEMLKVSINTK
jgi:hypothetical protein